MSKVVVLGMDGLDPQVVERMWDELPNFRRLRDEGVFMPIDSVFPPDSIPAWATIYTGLQPDEHGILDSIDYLDAAKKNLKCDATRMRGHTFWDVAGEHGKRVCIINPFLAYPVWPVNGIMANGPVFVSGEIQTHPESLLSEYEVPELGGIVDSPTNKTLAAFAEKTTRLTLDFLRFGKELYKREPWDLFFINLLALDRMQHVFWRYCDPNDPTYPGKNPHQEVIDNFYRLHDKVLGEFLDLIDNDTVLLVLGDHGHGMRCTKAVYVNEFLREKGFLKSNTSRSKLDPKYLVERAKIVTLRTLDKYDLQDWAYKIGKLIPGAKALKKSTFVIDKSSSKAQVARFAGMNPYGGIDFPRSAFNVDDETYNSMMDDLLQDLKNLKDPKTGKSLVKWAKRREEMFDGPHAGIYPEIIFQLDFEYGVSRSLFGPLVDVNPSHKKVSGGHMPQAAFFANRRMSGQENGRLTIQAIAPTVLHILGVDAPEAMCGGIIRLQSGEVGSEVN